MNSFNLDELLEKVEKPEQYALSGSSVRGNSPDSVSLVYSPNGKRVSISKSLSQRLGIENDVSVAVVPSQRILIIGKSVKGGSSYSCKSASGKVILYNAQLVEGIVYGFGLQDLYKNGKTSLNFRNIEFDEDNNLIFVTIPDAKEFN